MEKLKGKLVGRSHPRRHNGHSPNGRELDLGDLAGDEASNPERSPPVS